MIKGEVATAKTARRPWCAARDCYMAPTEAQSSSYLGS